MADVDDNKAAGLRRSVIPEVETLVSIETLPKAVCFLYHERAKQHRLQLDSDDGGIVRFHAKAHKKAAPIDLKLDCTDENGKKVIHTIEMRGDPRPDSTPERDAAPKSHGKLRPALEGDPLALSNEELFKRGYPRWPDPARAPIRYARWLRNVSQQFIAVNPRLVAHPVVSSREDSGHHRSLAPRSHCPRHFQAGSSPTPAGTPGAGPT
jgi:hypothetical protein